jgi:PhnB protein
MPNKVNAIPEGYHTATPYLIVKNGAQAIDFYKKAFGATELFRMADPSGKVRHAEIKIGNSPIMLAEEFPEFPEMKSPESRGGTTVFLYLYVEDVDRVFKQAVSAGAKEREAVQDKFYGDRTGAINDPFGHVWFIATHKEDVSSEELKKRAAAAAGKG